MRNFGNNGKRPFRRLIFYKVYDFKSYKKGANINELGLIIVTIVNIVCALINLFCFIKDRMD
nr:MAG TPA: hypothetical protein [Caudoviricetes sp.]